MTNAIIADLQEGNIMLGLDEDAILEAFEEAEREDPSPFEMFGEHIIYHSRQLEIPKRPGRPIITDFGEARFSQSEYIDDIIPFQYRAPEVIFDVP